MALVTANVAYVDPRPAKEATTALDSAAKAVEVA